MDQRSRKQQASRTHHNASSTPRSKHQRTHSTLSIPTLSRNNSSGNAPAAPSHSRRASNPSTPTTRTPRSTATSPSYFSPQPNASGAEPRSPANRRPPASFSGHGIDNSRGPPIALITRGSYSADIARRSQKPSDFAVAQQQSLQLGLVSPGASASKKPPSSVRSSSSSRERTDQQTNQNNSAQRPHNVPPQSSNHSREEQMESSLDESSDYDSGRRSHLGDTLNLRNRRRAAGGSGTDGEQSEDLFLHVAQDNGHGENQEDAATRIERRRSRIARVNNRQSAPPNTYASPDAHADSPTPTQTKIPSPETAKPRRASYLPSPNITLRERETTPRSPANVPDSSQSRHLGLSPQTSITPKSKDQFPSPQLLPHYGRRRPSYPDAGQTPPNRAHTYKPSNLHYTSSRDDESSQQLETTEQNTGHSYTHSRADGTESIDSANGPAPSVWDELDELKSRIRRIELTGQPPSTSAQAVSSSSAERPKTATTAATTVSSSPKRLRKASTSPSESTMTGHTAPNVHPLLHTALAKAKEHVAPQVYRVLESAAKEALELASLTGSAGPQGTLFSASSIINGATVPDRQVRRKADNLCRSLTELCISLCEVKTSPVSPAFRVPNASSRRTSVHVNGDMHTSTYNSQIRQSIEPERSSPSRALSRIEARRTSVLGLNGSPRESSQEPPTPRESSIATRLNRAGQGIIRARSTANDEEEELTLRIPSRAMTEVMGSRSTKDNRLSREYTSREPMPELQPSPSLAHASLLRRPQVSTPTENTPPSVSLLRNDSRRYRERQTPERTLSQEEPRSEERRRTLGQYTATSRTSAATSGLSRTGSLGRRYRGTTPGE